MCFKHRIHIPQNFSQLTSSCSNCIRGYSCSNCRSVHSVRSNGVCSSFIVSKINQCLVCTCHVLKLLFFSNHCINCFLNTCISNLLLLLSLVCFFSSCSCISNHLIKLFTKSCGVCYYFWICSSLSSFF